MPLVDLKTNLKSLKYGHDRPGGGSSDQPYIKTDINTLKNGVITIPNFLGFDDGLVRGGLIGAANASITDTFRIGKFLLDLPKGPLFIAKQVGLQLSNPRLETKKTVTGEESRNIFSQPTRLYNLGINTIAQIPVNAFGLHFERHGLLPIQDDQTKYEAVVAANNNETTPIQAIQSLFGIGNLNQLQTRSESNTRNRLVGLKRELGIIDQTFTTRTQIINPQDAPEQFIPGEDATTPGIGRIPTGLEIPQSSRIAFTPLSGRTFNPAPSIQAKGIIPSLSYFGGPGSVYGIGNTNIRRYSITNAGEEEIKKALIRSKQITNNLTSQTSDSSDIERYITVADTGVSRQDDRLKPFLSPETNGTNVSSIRDNTAVKYASVVPSVRSYQELVTAIEKTQNSSPLNNIFKLSPSPTITTGSQGLYNDTNLNNDITYQNSYGQKVVLKTFNQWSKVAREQRIGDFGKADVLIRNKTGSFSVKKVTKADSLNLTPVFAGSNNTGVDKYFGDDEVKISGVTYNVRDLCKFRIQSVNTDAPDSSDFMFFRAHLTQLSDNVDAAWNDINYVGRGNPFYIYKGFSRKVSIGFKVAALSREEMQPMYSKLNYLMASLMPDYSNNLMRGSLHRMTIGNYFDAQLGVINSISYKIPDDSPWEIALDEPEGGISTMILPHIIEVSMEFTPIGAETQTNNLIEAKNRNTSYIAQNNTGADVSWLQYYDSFTNVVDVTNKIINDTQ